MKVLLVRPNATIDEFKIRSESLAIGYLAAYLREYGVEVDILDAYLENFPMKKVVDTVLNGNYGLVGFSIYSSNAMQWTRTISEIIKKNAPDIHITIGGHLPSFDYEYILRSTDGIDTIVLFEGEETLLELVTKLKESTSWKETLGIAFKENGSIVVTGKRPLIYDLDQLPFPARDYLPYLMENYSDEYLVYINWGRGCYRSCKFCSVPAFFRSVPGKIVRKRSVDSILKEVAYLKYKFGISYILFIDDIFILPYDRGYEDARKLLRGLYDMNIRFALSERVDVLNEDLVNLFVDSGMVRIFLGLEAADNEILKIMDKKIDTFQIIKTMNMLTAQEIDVEVSFINFLPFNTLENIENNIKFFTRWNVDILRSIGNRLEPYPGTMFYKELKNNGNIERLGYFYNYRYNMVDERVDRLYNSIKEIIPYWGVVSMYLQSTKSFIWKLNVPSHELSDLRNIILELQGKIVDEVKEYFLNAIDLVRNNKSNDIKYQNFEHKGFLQEALAAILDLKDNIKRRVNYEEKQ